jgi:hypothetical protein
MLDEGRSSILAKLYGIVEDHFHTIVHIPYADVRFLGIRGIFYCVLPIALEAAKLELNVNFRVF